MGFLDVGFNVEQTDEAIVAARLVCVFGFEEPAKPYRHLLTCTVSSKTHCNGRRINTVVSVLKPFGDARYSRLAIARRPSRSRRSVVLWLACRSEEGVMYVKCECLVIGLANQHVGRSTCGRIPECRDTAPEI